MPIALIVSKAVYHITAEHPPPLQAAGEFRYNGRRIEALYTRKGDNLRLFLEDARIGLDASRLTELLLKAGVEKDAV